MDESHGPTKWATRHAGGLFDAYRDEISVLLDRIDEQHLASDDRDAIATGIRVARQTGEALRLPNLQLREPKAFGFGERILRLLTDADEDEVASHEPGELSRA